MKKISLILVLIINVSVIFAQNDTVPVKNDVQTAKEKIEGLENSINQLSLLIEEKAAEIEAWAIDIDVYLEHANENEQQIDSVSVLIDENAEIIDELADEIDDLADEIDDLVEELEYVGEDLEAVGDDEEDIFPGIKRKFKKKKFKGHWEGVFLGVNTYVREKYSFDLSPQNDFMTNVYHQSWEFSINPFQFSIPFFTRYFGMVSGLGIKFNNYELSQNVFLKIDSTGVLTHEVSDKDYIKNRFKTTGLTVPLLLEGQIPVSRKDNRIFITAGVVGELIFSGRMKTVYMDGNNKIKNKDKLTKWPISAFSYHATVRVGYKRFYAYANSSFIPIFTKNKGPELYPVSAGIGFCF